MRSFDVSPIDGALAYVSGFDLFVANADGGERRSVLHDESEINSNDDHRRAGARYDVAEPKGEALWSPAGQGLIMKTRYFDKRGKTLSDMLWLPIDGGAATELRIDGDNLHWGKP